jgi:hypothetical protein
MQINSITLIIRDVDGESASVETVIDPVLNEDDEVEVTPCVVMFESILDYLENGQNRNGTKAYLH